MSRLTATKRHLIRDFGTCLSFNGSSDFVNIGTLGAFVPTLSAGTVTISTWFKIIDNGARQVVCGEVNTGTSIILQLFLNSNNTGAAYSKGLIFFQTRDTTGKSHNFGITTAYSFNDNRWHHIAIVVTPSTNTGLIYLDGVSQTVANQQSDTPNSFATLEFALYLGGRNLRGALDMQFKGLLDETRLYQSGLTATQIADMYYTGIGDPTKFSWYKFDEGSGTSATDSGSGGNTGTITGATYSTDVFMKARSIATNRIYIGDL